MKESGNRVCSVCEHPVAESRRVLDVLRARRFEFVDWAERVWATFGFNEDDEVEFSMLNRRGESCLMLCLVDEEPEIQIAAAGNSRVSVGMNRGALEVRLADDNGHDKIHFQVDREGHPHIFIGKEEQDLTTLLTSREQV